MIEKILIGEILRHEINKFNLESKIQILVIGKILTGKTFREKQILVVIISIMAFSFPPPHMTNTNKILENNAKKVAFYVKL